MSHIALVCLNRSSIVPNAQSAIIDVRAAYPREEDEELECRVGSGKVGNFEVVGDGRGERLSLCRFERSIVNMTKGRREPCYANFNAEKERKERETRDQKDALISVSPESLILAIQLGLSV